MERGSGVYPQPSVVYVDTVCASENFNIQSTYPFTTFDGETVITI